MAFPTAHGKTDRIKPCQSIKINQVNPKEKEKMKRVKNKPKGLARQQIPGFSQLSRFSIFFFICFVINIALVQSVTLKPIFSFLLSVLYSSMRVCL